MTARSPVTDAEIVRMFRKHKSMKRVQSLLRCSYQRARRAVVAAGIRVKSRQIAEWVPTPAEIAERAAEVRRMRTAPPATDGRYGPKRPYDHALIAATDDMPGGLDRGGTEPPRYYVTTAHPCILHRALAALSRHLLDRDRAGEWPGEPMACVRGRLEPLTDEELARLQREIATQQQRGY
jgi:hypothetical protein